MNEILITINGVTKSLNQNADFVLENAENMRWGKLELATTTNPFVEGDFIQNARGLARDITLTLRFLNTVSGAGAAKDWFYTAFNKQATLTWVGMGENNTNWTIQGFVDEIDEDTKTNSSILTVNIHCSNPYWEGAEKTITTTTASPVANIIFSGNAPMGIVVDFTAEIYNSTGEELYPACVNLQLTETDSTFNPMLKVNSINFYSEDLIPQGTYNDTWRFSTVRGDRHLYLTGTDSDETFDEFIHGMFFYVQANQPYRASVAYRNEGEMQFTLKPFTLKYKPRWL